MKTSIINITNSFKNVYLDGIAENDIITKIYTHVYGDDMPLIEYHIKLTAENVYKAIAGMLLFARVTKEHWEYDESEQHLTLNTIYYNDRDNDIEEIWFNIYFE